MLRIITLIFSLSLILTVTFPVVDAHIDTPLVHRHAPAVNRMIKKRAALLNSGINDAAAPANAAADPNGQQAPNNAAAGTGQVSTSLSNADSFKPTDSQLPNDQPAATAKPSATITPVATAPTASPATQSDSASSALPIILSTILGGQSANTSVSTSSSISSTSASSSSTPLTLSSSSSAPSLTQSSTPTVEAQSHSIDPITITSSASPSATSAASTSSGSVTKLQRNTIIILIAIGASIGAAGIIWTIIRKWKFRPSSSFEDRMQPIDWQPTTGPHDGHDITEKLTRNGSTRSHGSFTSGNNNHDNLTADLPPHDFTPGPAHLAPVGGYADLQRGPSPQPDLQRGPSFRAPGESQYEMPNPHGQYYNGAGVGVGGGAYQGGYDHNRGY